MEFLSLLLVKINLRRKNKQILIGKLGEKFSELKLKELGFIIWHTNYESKFGEIDIVASKERTLYVIEVKTRKLKNISNYSLRKQVNEKKLRKLKTLLKIYKKENISELKKRRIIKYGIKLSGVAYVWENGLLPKFNYWELRQLNK